MCITCISFLFRHHHTICLAQSICNSLRKELSGGNTVISSSMCRVYREQGRKNYCILLHNATYVILHNIANFRNDFDDFAFHLMLTLNVATRGHTWPPAEASSCGNLSTLQPTGTIHVTSIARRRHCVGTCHHYVYHMLIIMLIICRHVASLFKSLRICDDVKSGDPISPSQVFVAANSNAVLRLVHVDPLGTPSKPLGLRDTYQHKTHQHQDWFS